MVEVIRIEPGKVYNAIRGLIPHLPEDNNVLRFELDADAAGGSLTIITINRPTEIVANELVTTAHHFELLWPLLTTEGN